MARYELRFCAFRGSAPVTFYHRLEWTLCILQHLSSLLFHFISSFTHSTPPIPAKFVVKHARGFITSVGPFPLVFSNSNKSIVLFNSCKLHIFAVLQIIKMVGKSNKLYVHKRGEFLSIPSLPLQQVQSKITFLQHYLQLSKCSSINLLLCIEHNVLPDYTISLDKQTDHREL